MYVSWPLCMYCVKNQVQILKYFFFRETYTYYKIWAKNPFGSNFDVIMWVSFLLCRLTQKKPPPSFVCPMCQHGEHTAQLFIYLHTVLLLQCPDEYCTSIFNSFLLSFKASRAAGSCGATWQRRSPVGRRTGSDTSASFVIKVTGVPYFICTCICILK